MTTSVVTQPNSGLHTYNLDLESMHSYNPAYSSGTQRHLATGDLIFDKRNGASKVSSQSGSNAKSSQSSSPKVPSIVKPLSSAKTKPGKQFIVSRKNSLKSKNFRHSQNSNSIQSSRKDKRKRTSYRFDTEDQINSVFELNPNTTNLPDFPSYMVQYFVRNKDLIKVNPVLKYRILEAHLSASYNNSHSKETERRKCFSTPIPLSYQRNLTSDKIIKDSRHKSMPDQIFYAPSNLTMSEYLRTSLDLNAHRKVPSHSTITSTVTRNTLLTNETRNSAYAYTSGSGSESRTGTGSGSKSATYSGSGTRSGENTGNGTGSGSGDISVETAVLESSCRLSHHPGARRPSLSKSIHSIPTSRTLATKRKDAIIRKSVQFSGSPQNQNILEVKHESFEKFGVSPKPVRSGINAILKNKENQENSFKRLSSTAVVSIESGSDLYNQIKNEIFGQKSKDWEQVSVYLRLQNPEIWGNDYFILRLMIELYFRRIVAARIALKMGTDISKKGGTGDFWLGLKDIIDVVYGKEQMKLFEEQKYQRDKKSQKAEKMENGKGHKLSQ